MSDLRRVIVVDTETTGLDTYWHRAVEVAWLGWRCEGSGVFVPPHRRHLRSADPEALRVNGYRERIAWRDEDAGYVQTRKLHEVLRGATLAGANVRFDAAMLSHLFRQCALAAEPWHHRLLDVEAYAAGKLNIPPGRIPGLRELCLTLGVAQPTHGAWDDVQACAQVLSALAPAEEAAA